MTSEDKKPLSTVKDQVAQMFNSIHKLETKDKSEAFSFVRTYLDDSKLVKNGVVSNRRSRKNKIETNTENVKSNNRKLKFNTRIQRVKKAFFKCRACGAQFKTKALLFKHLETHIGTPISCRLCKTSFNSNISYICHISLKMCKKTKKSWKTYCCDQCNKIFRYKRHFDRHVEGHKRNNCTYCDARLTRRKQLVNHLMIAHSIKLERTVMFKCEYCEKRYVKKRSLYHHLKQHADDKIVCNECGQMSATIEEHNIHFSQHDKDRPWKCDKCNDRFSRRQQYLIHIKRHDRYKCISCDETFASKARVLRHKQRGHSVHGLEPQLKCPHCPMAFQRRLTLQIHMKKHSDDKLMYCKYCNKHFRTPYLYFKHCATTVHDVNSPLKQQLVCEICGKLFVKKYLLDQHLQRVHNLSKQAFTCEYCGHRTTNRTNLERHLTLHMEDKKQTICDKCGKAFYNIITLKDHISYVHLQERDFKCNQCDKAFKRNSELIRHKTSHSELRPHVCTTCGVSYKRSTHLRRHEETQHGTLPKNRRVQRLTKDDNGQLIPVPQPKKSKNKKAVETSINPKQVISFLDPQSGEMVSFTLPDEIQDSGNALTTIVSLNNPSFNQDVAQTLPYQQTNLVFNPNDSIILANDYTAQSLNLVGTFDQNFTGFTSHDALGSGASVSNPFVPETIRIENSTTCDILLPENRILNLQSQQNISNDFSQNSYQYL